MINTVKIKLLLLCHSFNWLLQVPLLLWLNLFHILLWMFLLYSYLLLFLLELFDFNFDVIHILVNYFCCGGEFDVVFGGKLAANKRANVFDEVTDLGLEGCKGRLNLGKLGVVFELLWVSKERVVLGEFARVGDYGREGIRRRDKVFEGLVLHC